MAQPRFVEREQCSRSDVHDDHVFGRDVSKAAYWCPGIAAQVDVSSMQPAIVQTSDGRSLLRVPLREEFLVEQCAHEELEISDDGVYVCKQCRQIVGFS